MWLTCGWFKWFPAYVRLVGALSGCVCVCVFLAKSLRAEGHAQAWDSPKDAVARGTWGRRALTKLGHELVLVLPIDKAQEQATSPPLKPKPRQQPPRQRSSCTPSWARGANRVISVLRRRGTRRNIYNGFLLALSPWMDRKPAQPAMFGAVDKGESKSERERARERLPAHGTVSVCVRAREREGERKCNS